MKKMKGEGAKEADGGTSCKYIVMIDRVAVFDTCDLGVAIGYRRGLQKGSVLMEVLPEFKTAASPVLPKRKNT